jgi:hypothetical protein
LLQSSNHGDHVFSVPGHDRERCCAKVFRVWTQIPESNRDRFTPCCYRRVDRSSSSDCGNRCAKRLVLSRLTGSLEYALSTRRRLAPAAGVSCSPRSDRIPAPQKRGTHKAVPGKRHSPRKSATARARPCVLVPTSVAVLKTSDKVAPPCRVDWSAHNWRLGGFPCADRSDDNRHPT